MAMKAASAKDAVYSCSRHPQNKIPIGLECPDCINSRLEIIRNSVVENERVNVEMKREINKIFETCARLGSPDPKILSLHKQYHEFDNSHGRYPKPDYKSVQSLALGFQKLKQLNESIKTRGMTRATESLKKKQTSLEEQIAVAGSTLAEQRDQLHSKKEQLWETYHKRTRAMDADIADLRGQASRQISTQGILFQYAHYNVIREYVFSTNAASPRPGKLLLFDKPVLQLGSFLSNNNHIVAVNTFLEDLIRLQTLLYDLFSISNEALELPFLEELQKLLPGSQFYDSVQQKIDSIVSDTHIPSHVSPDPGTPEEITDIVFEPKDENADKIVIRNNTIHVPVSFQTRNFKRRTSLRDTSDGEDAHEFNEDVFEKSSKSPSVPRARSMSPGTVEQFSGGIDAKIQHSPATPDPKSNDRKDKKDYTGKRIIIVPHKFLTKPFTKLKPHEYLKFLSSVVKILVNFNVFLQQTVGESAAKSRKFQGSSSFTFRKKDDLGPEPGFIYDISAILQQLAQMDNYFKDKRPALSQTGSLSSVSSKLDTSQFSSNSESESLGSTWVETMPVSRQSLPIRVPKLQAFYERFVHTRRKGPSVDERKIYGLVSETQSEDSKERTEKPDIKDSTDLSNGKNFGSSGSDRANDGRIDLGRNKLGKTTDFKSVDLKVVMKRVHDIISGAGGGLRDSTGAKGPDMRAALSMMEQSKVQMEDWDVVSRMY